MTRPVVPQDAATLILLRQDLGEPRILMGRRAAGHIFMPHKWVFPGGRIERGDYHHPVAGELPDPVADALAATARLSRQDGRKLARALAVAAIRETFEETGLMLARPAAPCHSRRNLFGIPDLQPDLSGVGYMARAITPPSLPRRYDARFLVADASSLVSLDPTDSHELSDLDWFTLDDARKLDLARVTRRALHVLEEKGPNAALHIGG